MTTPNRYQKLKAYSLFSTAFLFNGPTGFNQVVYVDIDPDIILDTPGEQFTLDIDGNGADDISFFNSSFDFYMVTPWWSYWTRQDLVANIFNENIALAGFKHYDWYNSSTQYYPFVLENGMLINDELTFNNGNPQLFALRTLMNSGMGTSFGNNCYWMHLDSTVNEINKYIGFKLIDEEEVTHFGWIRCDVLDIGRTMIIKDYAYELTPDNPIVAGDTAHYVGLSTQQEKIEPIVYCENKKVFISNLNKNYDVSIYNLNGGIIINKEVKTGSVEFDLQNVATGAYLVVFKSENDIRSKKIIIN